MPQMITIFFCIMVINIACLIGIYDKEEDSLFSLMGSICISNTITSIAQVIILWISLEIDFKTLRILSYSNVPNLYCTILIGWYLIYAHKFIIQYTISFIMASIYFIIINIVFIISLITTLLIVIYFLIPIKEDNDIDYQNIENGINNDAGHKIYINQETSITKNRVFDFATFLFFVQCINIFFLLTSKYFFLNIFDILWYVCLINLVIYLKKNEIKLDIMRLYMMTMLIITLLFTEIIVLIIFVIIKTDLNCTILLVKNVSLFVLFGIYFGKEIKIIFLC